MGIVQAEVKKWETCKPKLSDQDVSSVHEEDQNIVEDNEGTVSCSPSFKRSRGSTAELSGAFPPLGQQWKQNRHELETAEESSIFTLIDLTEYLR